MTPEPSAPPPDDRRRAAEERVRAVAVAHRAALEEAGRQAGHMREALAAAVVEQVPLARLAELSEWDEDTLLEALADVEQVRRALGAS